MLRKIWEGIKWVVQVFLIEYIIDGKYADTWYKRAFRVPLAAPASVFVSFLIGAWFILTVILEGVLYVPVYIFWNQNSFHILIQKVWGR